MRTPIQQLLACIGDPSRYRLLVHLVERRLCVSELATEVGLSQSCTTRHLQALSAVGLVLPAREGKRVVYTLRTDDPEVDRVLQWVRGSGPAPTSLANRPARRPRSNPKKRVVRRVRVAASPVPEVAPLTEPVAPVDGARSSLESEIERPARTADLEDFLL